MIDMHFNFLQVLLLFQNQWNWTLKSHSFFCTTSMNICVRTLTGAESFFELGSDIAANVHIRWNLMEDVQIHWSDNLIFLYVLSYMYIWLCIWHVFVLWVDFLFQYSPLRETHELLTCVHPKILQLQREKLATPRWGDSAGSQTGHPNTPCRATEGATPCRYSTYLGERIFHQSCTVVLRCVWESRHDMVKCFCAVTSNDALKHQNIRN